MFFIWGMLPFSVLMVLVGNKHDREEHDNVHSDSFSKDGKGLEGDEGNDGENESEDSNKLDSIPLWKYVTKPERGRGGEPIKFMCKKNCHEGKPYSGSYTHVRRHLCGILPGDKATTSRITGGIKVFSQISNEERAKYIKEEEAAKRKFGKKQKFQSDATSRVFGHFKFATASSPNASGSEGSHAGGGSRSRTIEDLLDVGGRDKVDAKVARFLYACAIPFNVLRSPYWHAMFKAIHNAPKGYKIPRYEKARTVLLDREKSKVQRALGQFTNEWTYSGVSVVFGSWTNVKNQHLIKILGVSASGAVFLAAHDSSSFVASSQNIADLLLKSINDIGPSNVIQVITNNAANCKGARKIIELVHPHIFWSGCLVHTLNLLMRDIFKHKECDWINALYKKGKFIIKFITEHTDVHYIYQVHSNLQLLKLARTRFGSYYLTFRLLLKVRQTLANMVVSDLWEHLRIHNTSDGDNAFAMQATILDPHFWSQVKYVLQFTEPIYNAIQFADSDQPVIGEVYAQMDTMLGQIKDIVGPRDVNLYDYIRIEVEKSWAKLNIPLHALAYVLTPKYYSTSWLKAPAPGGGVKRKPFMDLKVHNGYMQALDKLFPDEEECAVIRKQLATYISDTRLFGYAHSLGDREKMTSLEWWNMYGGSIPQLQRLAKRVLAQVVNTSSAERCWGSFIPNVKRNRLNVKWANSLVYVHHNLWLLSHYCEEANIDKTYKFQDNYPEEDNLEDEALALENLNTALFDDDDDHVEMPPPPIAMFNPIRTPVARALGPTSSPQIPQHPQLRGAHGGAKGKEK